MVVTMTKKGEEEREGKEMMLRENEQSKEARK